MRAGSDRDGSARRAALISELSEEVERNRHLLDEQAASIARYKKMYERASALARIGVWECDLPSNALTWTDGVYEQFDLPVGSPLCREQILEHYEEESRRQLERIRSEAIRMGGSFILDVRIVSAKGNRKWIRIFADVEQKDGAPVRIFGTKQDVTEEKRSQEELKALEAELIHVMQRSAMGTMAETLAHELNQPLSAIVNYAAATRRVLTGAPSDRALAASGLDAIESSAMRAGNIIRSLRAMTQGSNVKRQVLSPNPLIREAATLALAGGQDEVDLRFALVESVAVFVDPVQIQQVLINIIRNAADAVRGGPRRDIEISSRVSGGAVLIKVEDSGPGIEEELLGSIFESFVSSKPKGIGVGLSISRTIVEAHEGKIGAWNRQEGGACFAITLPLAAEPAT